MARRLAAPSHKAHKTGGSGGGIDFAGDLEYFSNMGVKISLH
jgi:hypothetical protein